MNTDQNTRHIYKTEDIDWDGLKAAGISKKQLEAEGNMELLLQGKETGIVPLKLHISVLWQSDVYEKGSSIYRAAHDE